jgi:integrase
MKIGVKVKSKDNSSTVTYSSYNTSKEGGEGINSNENNRAYFNFINSLSSPSTRKTYEYIIKKYMKYYNIQDINELLAYKDNPTIIENNIIDWLVALRKTVEYNTRCTYYAILMTFYEVNDINLRKKKIARYLGQQSTRKHKDRAYTIEEIRKILEHADIRSKVLVLLLISSGMRLGAVSDIRLRHLKRIEEYNLYRITVYENTKDEYYTFCTSECAAMIDSYLAYRQQSGENIGPNTPLIRERFDVLDIKEGSARKKPQPVQTRGISEIISTLLLKSGIVKTTSYLELERTGVKCRSSERKAVKRAHGMRKFNLTTLISAGVNPIIKEMLIGHKSMLGLDNNYYKPTEQQVLQEYLKAVDFLTINDEHRLQKKVAILEKKQDDIEMLKAAYLQKDKKVEELERQMKEFMEIAHMKLNLRDNHIKQLQKNRPKATKEEEVGKKLHELYKHSSNGEEKEKIIRKKLSL